MGFNLGEVMSQDTKSQLRGDTIWTEGGAGNIYLKQNADVYECTVEGNIIKDKAGRALSKDDDTYTTIIKNSKKQAAGDDTILKELLG